MVTEEGSGWRCSRGSLMQEKVFQTVNLDCKGQDMNVKPPDHWLPG